MTCSSTQTQSSDHLQEAKQVHLLQFHYKSVPSCISILQAAMADIIKVYKGDSEVVVAEFQPGTQEGALYQAIHRAYGSGSLRNSEGFCVSDVSPDTGHGIYRFYVDAKGEGHLELSLQRHESPGR